MKLKILIAEDNKFTAIQYKKTLEKNGHSVIIASDGQDCVDKYVSKLGKTEFESINNNPFDLVILDHNMPKKNGVKAAQTILSAKPDQKILFATAYQNWVLQDQAGDMIKKLEILEKPFSLSQLEKRIERL